MKTTYKVTVYDHNKKIKKVYRIESDSIVDAENAALKKFVAWVKKISFDMNAILTSVIAEPVLKQFTIVSYKKIVSFSVRAANAREAIKKWREALIDQNTKIEEVSYMVKKGGIATKVVVPITEFKAVA